MGSLYERIGGSQAVAAAVDLFYDKMLADPELRPFFDGIDVRRQAGKLRLFLAYAFGGVSGYDGLDLMRAHAGLVRRGLSDRHFDATAAHLAATLEELGVDESLRSEVLALVGGTRDAVLGRIDVAVAG